VKSLYLPLSSHPELIDPVYGHILATPLPTSFRSPVLVAAVCPSRVEELWGIADQVEGAVP
jgi:hypothetical protein